MAALVGAESALANKSDITVGLFHCWVKQREKLLFNVQKKSTRYAEKKPTWLNQRALGFFRFAKCKMFYTKPLEKHRLEWEELLALCQPNLSAEF